MTSRTPTTKETDTILRDLDSAYSTYTGIIDLLGPYIEADMESQEVGGKLHIYQYVRTPSRNLRHLTHHKHHGVGAKDAGGDKKARVD